jgi:hypothetical protein
MLALTACRVRRKEGKAVRREQGIAKVRRVIDAQGTCLTEGWLAQRCTGLALDLEACRREIERRARLGWIYFAIGLVFGFLIRAVA